MNIHITVVRLRQSYKKQNNIDLESETGRFLMLGVNTVMWIW